jgi:L-histidine N-alpha-methyltransferase
MPQPSPRRRTASHMTPSRPLRPDVAALGLEGLLQPRKTLPPILFYDEEGCRLFRRITKLPEYYLTRTELALLPEVAPQVAAQMRAGAVLVEYGASEERKALFLLDALPRPRAYVAIDTAEGALAAMAARLRAARSGLAVHPLATDFLRPLRLPDDVRACPRLGFFPGSTIGNLEPPVATRFLQQAADTLGSAALFLVGVDLRKDAALLLRAYDDAQGVTAAFNRNLLRRLNREAAADFDPAQFAHRAVWNEAEGRIEMHLVSLRAQSVEVAGRAIRFAAGETIHTENSYKHTSDGFAALAKAAGWQVRSVWTDPGWLFSLHLLAAGPSRRVRGSREGNAVEKTRTSTGLPPQAPQACASTIPPRPQAARRRYSGTADAQQSPHQGAPVQTPREGFILPIWTPGAIDGPWPVR